MLDLSLWKGEVTEAPDHLTTAQAKLWVKYAPEFNLTDPTAGELLETACVHLELAKKSAETVTKEGLVITINNNQTRTAHPLIKVERDSRNLALKCLKELRAKYPAKTEQRQAKKSPRQQAQESK